MNVTEDKYPVSEKTGDSGVGTGGSNLEEWTGHLSPTVLGRSATAAVKPGCSQTC